MTFELCGLPDSAEAWRWPVSSSGSSLSHYDSAASGTMCLSTEVSLFTNQKAKEYFKMFVLPKKNDSGEEDYHKH